MRGDGFSNNITVHRRVWRGSRVVGDGLQAQGTGHDLIKTYPYEKVKPATAHNVNYCGRTLACGFGNSRYVRFGNLRHGAVGFPGIGGGSTLEMLILLEGQTGGLGRPAGCFWGPANCSMGIG